MGLFSSVEFDSIRLTKTLTKQKEKTGWKLAKVTKCQTSKVVTKN